MDNIQLFENQPIRTAWVEDEEEWYFSIVDVVGVLTEQIDYQKSRKYWNKLKQRLNEEGSQLVTNCHQLKMTAQDGKKRLTDVANTEQLLRIIQSVPSKKAEPFKVWLAQVGRERIEETIDPELTIERALETYARLGYDADWINQRLQTIRARKELTDQWKSHGVEQGKEYAILTDEVTRAWAGMSTRQYKKLKGLKKENLRDNMSTLELALNMLAEATTTELTKSENPNGLEENQLVARKGGRVAGNARREIEKETGKSVITSQNAKQLNEIEICRDDMRVKVGNITKIRTGKLDANASSEDGAYPFFTCSREPLRISSYSYDCECVLVAGNGDLNVKYYNGKFDAYQRTYIIEDNSNGKLFMPYLYLFMERYVEELRRQAIGGVIKYIKLGNLTDALLELPSFKEQKSIVKILFMLKNINLSKPDLSRCLVILSIIRIIDRLQSLLT